MGIKTTILGADETGDLIEVAHGSVDAFIKVIEATENRAAVAFLNRSELAEHGVSCLNAALAMNGSDELTAALTAVVATIEAVEVK